MRHSLEVLDGIRIADPCPMSWGGMRGGEQARHCSRCDKTVHDLSKLTTAAAVALVGDPNQRACVRVARFTDGTVVTRDRAGGPVKRGWRRVRRAVVVVGSWFGLVLAPGCDFRRTGGMVTGDIAPP